MNVTLKNDFHNTEASLRVSDAIYQGGATLTQSQLSRARSKLCGVDGCKCADGPGALAGCRGPQTVSIEEEWDRQAEAPTLTLWVLP